MLDSECAILFYFIFWVCYFSSGESSRTFLPHFCLVLWFSRSVVSASLWPHERQHTFSLSQSLLRFVFIDSVMPSDHLILCRPLLPLPSVFPSIRVFSNELALCIRWPKDWSFSFSISPSNEYSGFISLGNLGKWQQSLPVHECPLMHVQYWMYIQLLQGCTKWIKCKWSRSVF